MTSGDRELLELAAKAANINLYWMELSGPVTVEGGRNWNPLTDDGDALRLAVKLEINILPCMEITETRNPSYTGWIKESKPTDPCAAARRAIVRAAASIAHHNSSAKSEPRRFA